MLNISNCQHYLQTHILSQHYTVPYMRTFFARFQSTTLHFVLFGQKWSTAHTQFTFIPVMVFAVPCENMRRYMLAAGQAGMANGDYAFVQLDHEVKPFIDSDSIFSVSLTFS